MANYFEVDCPRDCTLRGEGSGMLECGIVRKVRRFLSNGIYSESFICMAVRDLKLAQSNQALIDSCDDGMERLNLLLGVPVARERVEALISQPIQVTPLRLP